MAILFEADGKSISLTLTALLLHFCSHSVHQSNSMLSLLSSILQYNLQSDKSFVFLLSLPSSLTCASPVIFITWHLFSMPPSINKQFLLSCFLSQLYFHLEPFYSLSSVAISVTSISLSSLSPVGPHPAPPLVYPVYQTTLPSGSIIMLWTVIPATFHFFLPCLFLLPAAPPLRWICNSESERVRCAEY